MTINPSIEANNFPVIEGYAITEQLYAGSRTLVYRGVQANSQRPVVIKVLRQAYPSFSELVQFRNQYAITKNLNIPGIVRPLGLETYANGYALVMADDGSISLQQYAQHQPLPVTIVIEIGRQLAEILHQLHQNRVIHKDIKPANILINPATQKVQLIDFSIASLLPKETQEIQNPNLLEGTLAYLAPEQTGRMNRGIDYRTDFYSLGVTLYELLTGQLPFTSENPLELVHCHIAIPPVEPHTINESIPVGMSHLVMKLMEKNAEDRYQSAVGLQHDLEQCLKQWVSKGTISEFELGQRDRSDKFTIPEKLYGRHQEVQSLLEAFERVANGTSEMMLVAGFSGIGKTAVVNEVHKPITKQQGYFIKGKFDQFNRNIPFSAFVQALRDLMGQLLSESDRQIAQWRDKIIAAVGENGQVLIQVIPELEKIIGSQPSVPELSGTAAQNRFNLLFQKFIEVFTAPEHPLVMFLDDLQWADVASLDLMKILMADKSYLLLLGAYRDNEVSPAHPFIITLEELKKTGQTVKTITLAPLAFPDTNQLVADTLRCHPDFARSLTELINRQTQGNPFFTTQFLKALHEEEQITFNHNQGYWECDIAQINTRSLTDDVVEFMALQLQKLPGESQEILKLAACIGNQFDLGTLGIISQGAEAEAATALWSALQSGLVIPQTEVYKFYLADDEGSATTANPGNVTYRFLHDRVQQAAYSLIPDNQKQTTHYHIGQLLLQQIAPQERESRIFELVNQLNYGTDLVTDQKERDELAQLNLIACSKARTATAYQAGRSYAAIGLSLLGANAWQRQYEMTLAFHNLAAEMASLCGDFAAMEQLLETVIAQAQSLLDQVNVYRIKIQANVAQNQLTEAIAIGQQFLQQLGVTFPVTPTEQDIQNAIAEIFQLIGDRDIEDLVNLPLMTDKEKIAIVQIANSIMPVAYICAPPLFPLLISWSVKLSIQYGNTSASAFAYACYGTIACIVLPDIDTGVKFGHLAIQLVSKLDDITVYPEVHNAVGLFIFHRKYPLKTVISLLQNSYTKAIELGNYELAGYCAQNVCLNSFWSGQQLAPLESDLRNYSKALVDLNQLTPAKWCRIHWQSILNLMGLAESPMTLAGEAFQETELLPQMAAVNDLLGLYMFWVYKLMLCYLFGEIDWANHHAGTARQYSMGGAGMISEAAFYFYDSLTALAALGLESAETSKLLQRVDENQDKLQQQWAKYAPMNHQHKVDLVAAEKCRVLGQKAEAIELYDKAIAGAKANEYIQEEALANELAAKFYLEWGKEKVAAGYMQEAYYCYARWGAKAKTDDLEKRYPHLLRPILQQAAAQINPFTTLATLTSPNISIHTSSSSNRASSSTINTTLDFATILKASQAISSTIQLDELLHELTQIILQNSGASRCALILPNSHGVWQVAAIATPGHTEICRSPLEGNTQVPVKLIQYIKNNPEVVVIDNLKTPLPVIGAYLSQYQPKSVLGLPILSQGNLRGILYLENLLTSGVFTRERLVILNFLCTQAAISLENAQLYQQAQDYASQLQDYARQLKTSQLQLIQSEKMSALGNLIAGVAHEINNPVGFISGNVNAAIEAVAALTEYLYLYQDKFPHPGEEIAAKAQELDIEYQLADLPAMLESMQVGCDRIAGISKSLRTFSRADKDEKISFNIHEGIDSTLLILKHRLQANPHRAAIQVVKHYGDFPPIDCFPGQLNQVFMNILANAIDAFDEAAETAALAKAKLKEQHITIDTEFLPYANAVEIRIADNGPGISEEVKAKIFDHLFTTKAVGKGTGLGLTIARQIVVEKHGGQLEVHSQLGHGTEFCIILPVGI
ncbi:ATP-binding sensor histidine kinase [[Phormidium] sp. ETS-05]|uniref:trifunctional serine/threonine-protein kinase/ATP-binding protein/sensor histidine kinase n=1 Tax=[Phormidium] sp. ETS-05 TaxID=222819 RepID=UPI0018EED19E|nr:ATP-binding sensor histidine kinase [[Phormidium] sp. ETS-05]